MDEWFGFWVSLLGSYKTVITTLLCTCCQLFPADNAYKYQFYKHRFAPSVTDMAFQTWFDRGIKPINENLYENGVFSCDLNSPYGLACPPPICSAFFKSQILSRNSFLISPIALPNVLTKFEAIQVNIRGLFKSVLSDTLPAVSCWCYDHESQ